MVSKTELAEMRLIAERDGFMLFEKMGRSSADWANLKLMRAAKHRSEKKWNWHLGWNGERLSQSRDAGLLEQYLPEIHRWVIASLPMRASEPRVYYPALILGDDV